MKVHEMPKITLNEEECWVIRSIRPGRKTVYFEAHNIWNTAPAHATIFRSEDAAQNVISDHMKILGRLKGEIVEVVPMYGALVGGGGK